MKRLLKRIIPGTSGSGVSPAGPEPRRVAIPVLLCLLTLPVLAGSVLWGRAQDDADLVQAQTLVNQGRREEAITKLTEYIHNNSSDVRGYLLLGRCYAETSQPAKAAETLQEAVRIAPKSAEAHADLGRMEAILGKDQEAKAELGRALELNPNHKEALLNLAKLLLREGNYAGALHHFSRYVELADSDVEAQAYLMQCAAKVRDLKVVESTQEKLLQLAPRDPVLHDKLGNWLSEDGLYEAALREFTLAIEIDPDSEKIHYNLATLYLRMDQPRKAIESLSYSPKSPQVAAAYHHLRGQCYEKTANGMEAYKEYQEAIEADPNEQMYFLSLASLLLAQNVPNAAYMVLTSALKRFPSSAPVQVAMGQVELRIGNVDYALKYYHAAIALDPGSIPARKLLGRIQFIQGKYEEAIRTSEEVERLSPNDPQPYFSLGLAYMKLPDKTDLALEAFLHSLRLSPQAAGPYYWIGMIYSQRKHDYRLGAQYLEEAVARAPNMTAAYQLLIQSYRLMGDDAKAGKAASRYREAMQRVQSQTEPAAGEPQQ